MKKSISVRGVFYARLRAHARESGITISSIVESEIEKGLLEEAALLATKEEVSSVPDRLELIARVAKGLAK